MQRFALGIFAEYVAAFFYMLRFHRILHHRMKTRVGEIDLVAVRGRTLVFIEVKARKHGIYEGIVSDNQQKRIRRAAEFFVSKNQKYQKYNIRFDLVVVQPYYFPVIIKNAF